MQLYRGSARRLSRDVASGGLMPLLVERFRERMLHSPSDGEIRSWERSLPFLADELVAAELDGVEVLLEYALPLSSRRVDALLIGSSPSGGISAVVWENKQWTAGEIEDVEERMVVVNGRLLLHPQQQVAQYVEYLTDFNQLAHEGTVEVSGLAFLHNASEGDVSALRSAALADLATFPLFTSDQSGALRRFLRARISGSAAAEAADDFLAARTRPSRQLLDHVEAQILGHDGFTLLDEQLVAYKVVSQAVEESRRSNRKTVVVVVGGPGTGKSVIAMQIVADLARRGFNVAHSTGSKSFTETIRKRVGRRAANLFRWNNDFMHSDPNELDALIVDEAHRVREVSTNRWTPKAKRSGRPQVDELIQVARVPVFLLDEYQGVRPAEIGNVQFILEAAAAREADVIEIDLDAHFRCGGSEAYVEWVEHLLELAQGGPIAWHGDDRFEVYVAESPEDLENWLRVPLDQGYSARLTAGFCWPWSDPREDGSLVNDVAIGEWRRPWNLKQRKRAPGIPSASFWATDPAGFGQVGCIYTAQGFEFDYAGVIMGADLIWTEDGWVSDPAASRDTVVRSADDYDELVRHTYKVLLTRGLRGCGIYSVDGAARSLLRGLVREGGARSHLARDSHALP